MKTLIVILGIFFISKYGGFFPTDIIGNIPEQTLLDLVSRYFWVLALTPALWILIQIFRWR